MKSLKKTSYPTNINPAHLIKLSSPRGIIEFCRGNTPDYASTYNVDDNSRAALAAGKLYRLTKRKFYLKLFEQYLHFLSRHVNGHFPVRHGFVRSLGLTRGPITQDSLGRLLWASSWILSREDFSAYHNKAVPLFLFSLARYLKFTHVRPTAYAVCGLSELASAAPSEELKQNIVLGAEKLCDALTKNKKNGWVWFENVLTYENARLPQALYAAYEATGGEKYLKRAEESLTFLRSVVFMERVFVPVGADEWYRQGRNCPLYVQQPVEAGAMCECLVRAYKVTGNKNYLREARLCMDWYGGKNTRKACMVNPKDGGVYDGINENNVTGNQGAEATLSYLLGACALQEAEDG